MRVSVSMSVCVESGRENQECNIKIEENIYFYCLEEYRNLFECSKHSQGCYFGKCFWRFDGFLTKPINSGRIRLCFCSRFKVFTFSWKVNLFFIIKWNIILFSGISLQSSRSIRCFNIRLSRKRISFISRVLSQVLRK